MSHTRTSSLAPTTARPLVEDFGEASEVSSAIQRALDVLEQTWPNVFECSNFLHQSGRALCGGLRHLQVGLDHCVACVERAPGCRNFFAIDCCRAMPRVRSSGRRDSTTHVSFAQASRLPRDLDRSSKSVANIVIQTRSALAHLDLDQPAMLHLPQQCSF